MDLVWQINWGSGLFVSGLINFTEVNKLFESPLMTINDGSQLAEDIPVK